MGNLIFSDGTKIDCKLNSISQENSDSQIFPGGPIYSNCEAEFTTNINQYNILLNIFHNTWRNITGPIKNNNTKKNIIYMGNNIRFQFYGTYIKEILSNQNDIIFILQWDHYISDDCGLRKLRELKLKRILNIK